jgi:hypothetical protein
MAVGNERFQVGLCGVQPALVHCGIVGVSSSLPLISLSLPLDLLSLIFRRWMIRVPQSWSRLSEQIFRIDKLSLCRG